MKNITQKGLWALLLALTLFAFVLVNILAGLVRIRYDTALDLTEEKLYALSGETQQILSTLGEETNVFVFASESEYPVMLREMMRRYAKLTDKLHVSYVDPIENPVLMSHYQQMGHALNAYDILVEGANRIRVVPYQSLIIYKDSQVSGIDLEQQLSGALLYTNSIYAARAVFTLGHNERPSAALKKLFSDNNFVVETKAVLRDEMLVPEVIIVAAPTVDFSPEHIETLKECVEGGSSIMVFLEPGEGAMPHLDTFLAEYGLKTERDVLFEEKAFAAGLPQYIIPMYSSHLINAYFVDNPVFVVSPSSSALQIKSDLFHTVDELLTTTPDAYSKSSRSFISATREEGDKTGRFTVAALSDGKIFLMGSRMVYSDDLMGATSYANRMFLTRVLNALWQQGATVSIPAKTLSAAPLPLQGDQAETIGVLLAVVLPLMVLALGAYVNIRRRKNL